MELTSGVGQSTKQRTKQRSCLDLSQVISNFELELPVRSLFEAPTVAKMALMIVQTLAQKANQQKIEEMLTELESISDKQVEQDLDNES